MKRAVRATIMVFSVWAMAAVVGGARVGAQDLSGAQGSAESRLLSGIGEHNRAAAGDASRLEVAITCLGPEGWNRPVLALAYHGSALTLKAAQAKKKGELFGALGLIDAGTHEIDAAVKAEPTNTEVRILRLENSLALVESSPADRRPQAREDLAFLDAKLGELDKAVRAVVEVDRGRLALSDRRVGEAMAAWRKAVLIAPESEAAARARGLLARYGD